AIIPTQEVEQWVGELNSKGLPNPVTLNIYPGPYGEYALYSDDGESRSSAPLGDTDRGEDGEAKGEYRKTVIKHSYINEKVREVSLNWVHNNFRPFENHIFVAILHDPSEQENNINNIHLAAKNLNYNDYNIRHIYGGSTEDMANQLWNSSDNAWYYNADIHTTFVKLFYPSDLDNLNKNQLSPADDYIIGQNAPAFNLYIQYK
ncbi:MAG TPA: DUF5110 domain-containing protein, partial [Cytophagaceae bacterium]